MFHFQHWNYFFKYMKSPIQILSAIFIAIYPALSKMFLLFLSNGIEIIIHRQLLSDLFNIPNYGNTYYLNYYEVLTILT